MRFKHMVCFGAGRRLELLEIILENVEIGNKIGYIVDNDEKKQNTKRLFKKKKIDVISLNGLKEKGYTDFFILITCALYSEVVKQLNEDKYFSKIDFYCLSLIAEEDAMQKEIPCNLKLNEKPLIPKVIHYCWFGKKNIPDKNKVWMETWRRFCPDYEIIEWNEDNYDITQNKFMYQAYQEKKWGFVPDYARLDIIYKYGGIYLDTDVELLTDMDDLLYQKGFAGFQNSTQVALGLGFGAVKGLSVIKKMIESYNDLDFINKSGTLNLITGPKCQTEILKDCGLKTNGEYQIIEDLTIYPEKVLTGKNIYTRKTILKPYTRAIHHFDGSWLDQKTKDMVDLIEKNNYGLRKMTY